MFPAFFLTFSVRLKNAAHSKLSNKMLRIHHITWRKIYRHHFCTEKFENLRSEDDKSPLLSLPLKKPVMTCLYTLIIIINCMGNPYRNIEHLLYSLGSLSPRVLEFLRIPSLSLVQRTTSCTLSKHTLSDSSDELILT